MTFYDREDKVVTDIDSMVGKTMNSVVANREIIEADESADELIFVADDGTRFTFYHSQNCCENVYIEDICGNLQDLVGSPLIQAEVTSTDSEGNSRDLFHTWTFYKFATNKGSVTVRWYGESNGYYSEEVDLKITGQPRED